MQAASVDHQCSASWNMAKVLLCEGYRFEIITLLYKYFTQMALNAIVRGKKPPCLMFISLSWCDSGTNNLYTYLENKSTMWMIYLLNAYASGIVFTGYTQ